MILTVIAVKKKHNKNRKHYLQVDLLVLLGKRVGDQVGGTAHVCYLQNNHEFKEQ
jgi:hypothetical protein